MLSKVDLQNSIYKKIIHSKTGSGTKDDLMRRLLINGSLEETLYEIFSLDDFEATEILIEKNQTDIRETHRVVKEYITRQVKTYDFFKSDAIDEILCPTFDLTREEILFLANTEPFEKFD